jgi:hypothetical protein
LAEAASAKAVKAAFGTGGKRIVALAKAAKSP